MTPLPKPDGGNKDLILFLAVLGVFFLLYETGILGILSRLFGVLMSSMLYFWATVNTLVFVLVAITVHKTFYSN